MVLEFFKYQGAGNDFIIVDNSQKQFDNKNHRLIETLCHRRFGIGADGLLLIENSDRADFEMVYFNADGNTGSMCGNGGRCAVAFARKSGIIKNNATLLTYDGIHKASILNYDEKNFNAEVSLQMNDVSNAEINDDFIFLDTGSPHYVKFVHSLSTVNVADEGRAIRCSERFIKDGTNVNFVQFDGQRLVVRTYERGVEDETLSCGTGVTASAIAYAVRCNRTEHCEVTVKTLGGDLKVKFNIEDDKFTGVYLQGPATFVYAGHIEV